MKRFICLLLLMLVALSGCRSEVTQNYAEHTDYIKALFTVMESKPLKVDIGIYKEGFSKKIVFYGNSEDTQVAMSNAVYEDGKSVLQTVHLENGVYFLDDARIKLRTDEENLSSSSWLSAAEIYQRNTLTECLSPYTVFSRATADLFPLVKLEQPRMVQYETVLLSSYFNKNLYVCRYIPSGRLYSFSGKLVYTIIDGQLERITMEINCVYRIDYNEYKYNIVASIQPIEQVPTLTPAQKSQYHY